MYEFAYLDYLGDWRFIVCDDWADVKAMLEVCKQCAYSYALTIPGEYAN